MATESNLGTVHVFSSLDSYTTNASSVGSSDLALVPMQGDIIAQSLGGNGYVKFSNGLIIQWGVTNGTGKAETQTFSFPVSFSSTVYQVITVPLASWGSSPEDNYDTGITATTLSTFTVLYAYTGVRFIAFGI